MANANTSSATARAALGLVALSLGLAACGGASDIPNLQDLPHQANENIDWRDQVIYQIMVDRFDNGDPNNDYNVRRSIPGRYHGGDWQGIIDRLDYLDELGVTTLWISPTFANTEEDAGFASYHGYWPFDFVRPNLHFGDLHKLRELTDAAHDRGMLVILDVIANHMGQLFWYDINGNGSPDDFIQGGGRSHTCVQVCDQGGPCTDDELTYCQNGADYLERIIEWDPEYDPRGIQGWTSVGFHGPADIRFTDWPEINRTLPPRPPSFLNWPTDKPWFDDKTWFNRRGRVYTWWREADYSQSFVRDQETTGDFPGGLKDLNTDNPDVRQALIEVYKFWIDVGDFDGFRIDTLKHIDRPDVDPNERGFYGEFTGQIRAHAAAIGKQNFFIFGEAFDGNDVLSGQYTFPGIDSKGEFGRVDSVFYFSQYYSVIKNVFMLGGGTTNIECMYNSRMGISSAQCSGFAAGPTYHDKPHAMPAEGGIGLSPQQALVNFIDNHDVARFLFAFEEAGGPSENGLAALRNAVFFQMTWDGIPCMYYGTEQAFQGGVDPANREDMFGGNPHQGYKPFDTEHDTFRYMRDLIAMRKQSQALRRGAVSVTWSTNSPRGETDSGIFAFERRSDDDAALVVINTADGQSSRTCAPAADGGACMQTSFAPSTVLTDIAPGGENATFTVAANGSLDVSVPARSGRVLVAR